MDVFPQTKSVIEDFSIGINVSRRSTRYILGETHIDDAHMHNCYEVYFNISGDVSFWVENTLYPVNAGDVIITRPNEIHHCIYNETCVHEHFCLWIVANGSYGGLLNVFTNREKGEGCRICLDEPEKEQIKEFLGVLYEAYEKGTQNHLKPTLALYSLLSIITKGVEKKAPPAKMPPLLSAAIEYINSHLSEKCICEDLAAKVYTSRSTLYRLFKDFLGISPAKYIEAKRMSLAKSLLAEKTPLSEICALCGYTDCSHFISVFKRRFGVTPYKYQKKL